MKICVLAAVAAVSARSGRSLSPLVLRRGIVTRGGGPLHSSSGAEKDAGPIEEAEAALGLDSPEDYDESMFEDTDFEGLMSSLGGTTLGSSGGLAPFGGAGLAPFGGAGSEKERGSGKNYEWQQTRDVMSASMRFDGDIAAPDIEVDVDRRRIEVRLRGEVALSGELGGDTLVDDTYWAIEADQHGALLLVDIAKKTKGMWRGLLAAEGDALEAIVTHKAFFDIKVNETDAGTITIGLFGEDVPETVANFLAFCEGDGVPSYEGNVFHRICPGFMCQAGDVTNGDGTGGLSIYNDGAAFPDEKFAFRHDAPGILSMANSGKDSNKSQFFFTFDACEWLNDKHVVFGRVLDGADVLSTIETCGTPDGTPVGTAVITRCGVLKD